MFHSLGFYEVVSTADALLMENRRGGAEAFIKSIPRFDGVCGAVVCNCDPFTLGHRHLIEHAAAACDSLYVFAVSESGSAFSPEDRLEMIKKGTADIPNCHVFASDLYLISRATFPAYFIKDRAQAETVKADLDIAFFAGKIAPALKIKKRFVGEEPLDPVTAEYNKRMKELLPQRGITLEEIPRLTDTNGEVISASRVRNLINDLRGQTGTDVSNDSGILEQIKALVPQTTYDRILEKI
jgi:[citrate (pro-3S)-lyase] ligase